MKTYRGTEAWFHSLLTSALDGGEWSTSHADRITVGGGGGVELAEPIARVCLIVLEKRKNLLLLSVFEPLTVRSVVSASVPLFSY